MFYTFSVLDEDLFYNTATKELTYNATSELIGATGVNGLNGATGVNGLHGSTGATGIDGATGVNGLNGNVGPQGPGLLLFLNNSVGVPAIVTGVSTLTLSTLSAFVTAADKTNGITGTFSHPQLLGNMVFSNSFYNLGLSGTFIPSGEWNMHLFATRTEVDIYVYFEVLCLNTSEGTPVLFGTSSTVLINSSAINEYVLTWITSYKTLASFTHLVLQFYAYVADGTPDTPVNTLMCALQSSGGYSYLATSFGTSALATPTSWSRFPATQSVDLSGNSLANVGTVNMERYRMYDGSTMVASLEAGSLAAQNYYLFGVTPSDFAITHDKNIRTTGDITCNTLNYTTLSPPISSGNGATGIQGATGLNGSSGATGITGATGILGGTATSNLNMENLEYQVHTEVLIYMLPVGCM